MDITSFKDKIEAPPNGRGASYINQYNEFWNWKISVEKQGDDHILDVMHVNDTCKKLLEILPRWQTYRGIKCDYEKELPLSMAAISHAYDKIRRYSLLEFDKIPDESLRLIWENLGLVKEIHRIKRPNSDYFIIAVCKPLMFIWGQTLAFDSINRINLLKDHSLGIAGAPNRHSRWSYSQWKTIMKDFQLELIKAPEIVDYCQLHSSRIFGTDLFVPYGRYIDLYYYY